MLDDPRSLYAIYAALAFTATYFVGILITYCLICQPLSAYWESYQFGYQKPFKCIDGNALTPIIGVLSIVSDIYAVVLPFFMLRHYQLDVPRRQRIGLNIIFSLGLVYAPTPYSLPITQTTLLTGSLCKQCRRLRHSPNLLPLAYQPHLRHLLGRLRPLPLVPPRMPPRSNLRLRPFSPRLLPPIPLRPRQERLQIQEQLKSKRESECQ